MAFNKIEANPIQKNVNGIAIEKVTIAFPPIICSVNTSLHK